MIWIFKENSFEAFENNVRVTTPLALKVPLALRRGVRGEAKGLGVRLFFIRFECFQSGSSAQCGGFADR